MGTWIIKKQRLFLYLLCLVLLSFFNFTACNYTFKDITIDKEVKTFRVNYFENKAQYVNTQLSPQVTEKLKQKIISTTRLHQTNDDDAHYDISGYISQYSTSTVSIAKSNSDLNRLSVGFHLSFKNTLDSKKNVEADLLRTFDFDANKSLSDAEAGLNNDIVSNLVDEIFNKIFSNW